MTDVTATLPLTKELFYQAAPKTLATKLVNVPELGGSILFSQLDGRQAGRLESLLYVDGVFQGEKSRAIWIVACARTADGQAMFDDSDLERLSSLPMSLLDRLSLEAKKLNAMGAFVQIDEADEKN